MKASGVWKATAYFHKDGELLPFDGKIRFAEGKIHVWKPERRILGALAQIDGQALRPEINMQGHHSTCTCVIRHLLINGLHHMSLGVSYTRLDQPGKFVVHRCELLVVIEQEEAKLPRPKDDRRCKVRYSPLDEIADDDDPDFDDEYEGRQRYGDWLSIISHRELLNRSNGRFAHVTRRRRQMAVAS